MSRFIYRLKDKVMKSFLVKFQHKTALIMTFLKIFLRLRLHYTICKEQCFLRLSEMEMVGTPRSFQSSVPSNGKSINII